MQVPIQDAARREHPKNGDIQGTQTQIGEEFAAMRFGKRCNFWKGRSADGRSRRIDLTPT
jgi:hypothetical protein